ncbi:MAG TPA: MBL fold metallo-hydrolase [Verrucomicrobiales bacterium]|nr:MBL fold metallo-hydrolase [Verrucomicrobiales bacterium]
MALVFERIQTEGIAELSYLLGDDSDGVAAVIDPTPDVDKYIELAREKKVSITHVFETHIHADLVSGARELCARVGSARVFVSHEGDARYGFDHEKLMDGDKFTFGKTVVTVKHTPGHTPEHVSYLMAAADHPRTPWGVLTGDSLFVNSAGRPDLLGSSETEKLTKELFHTLRQFFLKLPDGVMIYPAHGSGSPCGADIGDRLESSIGHERKFNPYLQLPNFKKFKEHALGSAPPVPAYYPRMKKLNAKGPAVLGNLPRVPGLPAKTFKQAVDEKAGVLVDTRMMLGFGGGHIKGAVNIGASPMLSIWAGWLLEPDEPILLVLDSDTDVDEVVKLFIRTGYTQFAGYLVGGMKAWDNAGFELEEVGQKTVHEIKEAAKQLQIVDVRSPTEWAEGRVPGAAHMFLPELRKKAARLDKHKPVAVYCESGYRASIGASILKQEGFEDVSNVPGSWQAWKKARFPVEKGGDKE